VGPPGGWGWGHGDILELLELLEAFP